MRSENFLRLDIGYATINVSYKSVQKIASTPVPTNHNLQKTYMSVNICII